MHFALYWLSSIKLHRRRTFLHLDMTEKQKQRRKSYDARNAQPDKENLSDIICNKFLAQSTYQQADTVMWYLHCRSEVRTLDFLAAALES